MSDRRTQRYQALYSGVDTEDISKALPDLRAARPRNRFILFNKADVSVTWSFMPLVNTDYAGKLSAYTA